MLQEPSSGRCHSHGNWEFQVTPVFLLRVPSRSANVFLGIRRVKPTPDLDLTRKGRPRRLPGRPHFTRDAEVPAACCGSTGRGDGIQ